MLHSHFPCNLFPEVFSLSLFHHSSRFTEYILVFHLVSTTGLLAIHVCSCFSGHARVYTSLIYHNLPPFK